MSKNYRPRIAEESTPEWEEVVELVTSFGSTESLRLLKGLKSLEDKAKEQFLTNLIEGENFIKTDEACSYLRTEEEVAKHHGIDTDKWYAKKKSTKYWEVGMKVKIAAGNEVVAKSPLHGLHIEWALKDDSIERIKEMLRAEISIPSHKPKKLKKKGKFCLELMISDFHLGKVGFDEKTMEFNWTLKEAGKAYSDCIDYILSQVDLNEVSEFVLPTGNDFLNIDSPSNTTTAGTPQMTPVFWECMFRYGKDLIIAAVEKLSAIAPVHLVMVRGNHDRNSVFTMGEVMKVRFENNPNVRVTNNPVLRPYHRFGKVLIGYDHADRIKKNDVYKCVSQDRPKDFGETKYRAMHVGHLHKNSKKTVMDFQAKDEVNGVEVEVFPSLSPCDRWHYGNLYVGNLRRTKAKLWDKEKGLVREIYYNL